MFTFTGNITDSLTVIKDTLDKEEDVNVSVEFITKETLTLTFNDLIDIEEIEEQAFSEGYDVGRDEAEKRI